MKNSTTKLTLRMDRKLVQRAKSYAKSSGKSVSAIVADFFELLEEQGTRAPELTPAVRSLIGVISPPTEEREYRRYLDRKHR